MPNPEKIKTSNNLHNAIEEAKKVRLGKASQEGDKKADSTSTSGHTILGGNTNSANKKKVLKKPTAADLKKISDAKSNT